MSIWLPRYWKRQNRVFSQLSILTLMNAPFGAFIENYFPKCARNENVSLVSKKAKYLHYIARTASLKLLYFNWDKFLNIWFTYKPLFTWGQCEWSCPSPCEKDTFKFFLLYPPVNSWKTDSNQLRCFGCSKDPYKRAIQLTFECARLLRTRDTKINVTMSHSETFEVLCFLCSGE